MTKCNGTKFLSYNSISLTFWTIFVTENIRYPFKIFPVIGTWGTKYLKAMVCEIGMTVNRKKFAHMDDINKKKCSAKQGSDIRNMSISGHFVPDSKYSRESCHLAQMRHSAISMTCRSGIYKTKHRFFNGSYDIYQRMSKRSINYCIVKLHAKL